MTEIFMTGMICFGITAAIMPFYIRQLQIMQWGQQIRPEGPKDHESKRGTPTMGGLIVLLALLSTLIWVRPLSAEYLVFMGVVMLNGLAGFWDDFIKIRKTRSLGLRARDKLCIQIIMGIALAYYVARYTPLGTKMMIPLVGDVDMGLLFYPLCILAVTGFVNAVNLTDGLDGLAAGTVVITLMGSAWLYSSLGHPQLMLGCIALTGALLGFLLFNCFPARVFMGDTGSLALGGAVAAMSILTGTEFFMVIMGGVFVMEALSVTMQVTYFKLTKGKRIFKMSPIHHHFALMGWHEVQVTTRFCIAGFILTALGVWLYSIR
jgi:phospho-N-acetylmuramoyl-pentapeptide-transferase